MPNLRFERLGWSNWSSNFDGGFSAWPNSHTTRPNSERPPWEAAGVPVNRHLCNDGQRLSYTGENGSTERSDLQDGNVVRGLNCFEISIKMVQYPTNLSSAWWWLIGPEIHGVSLNQAPIQPQVLYSTGTGAQGTGSRNRNSAYPAGEPRYFMDANAGRGPHRYWDMGPMVLNEWTYWRFNMNFTSGSGGFLEAWRGSQRMMRVDDQTTAESSGGYWKLPNYSNSDVNGTRGYDWCGARVWDGLCDDRSAGITPPPPIVLTTPTAMSATASGQNVNISAASNNTDTNRTGLGVYRKTSPWTADTPASGDEVRYVAGTGPLTLTHQEAPGSGTWYYSAFNVNKNTNTNSARLAAASGVTIAADPNFLGHEATPTSFAALGANQIRSSVFTIPAGKAIPYLEFWLSSATVSTDTTQVKAVIWNATTNAWIASTPLSTVNGTPFNGWFRLSFASPISFATATSVQLGIHSGNNVGSAISYGRTAGNNFYFATAQPIGSDNPFPSGLTNEPYLLNIRTILVDASVSSPALAPTAFTVGTINTTTGGIPLTLTLPADSTRTNWVIVRRYSNTLQNSGDPFEGTHVIVQQGTGTSAQTINVTDTPTKSGRYFYDAYTRSASGWSNQAKRSATPYPAGLIKRPISITASATTNTVNVTVVEPVDGTEQVSTQQLGRTGAKLYRKNSPWTNNDTTGATLIRTFEGS